MAGLPTGTVTFLFTDIEGSTKLAREHLETWELARARHHAILQKAIESYQGYVFQIIGDAFCAAFHTAGDAVRAAAKSQVDLHAENWRDTQIKVRMGIHTGKAEIQGNGEYHGYLAMSRIQRLMSAGHGGQVLISAASQELLLEDLPENVSLRDLGERRLKDLIRPEHIYQLMIPGLPVDFPPLKTLDFYRHNLPTQLTSFIGREKEMEEIKQSVLAHRLVTLTGVGGTGKTRLSLQVAADVLDQFRDGVWFVELASVSDPDLIAQTIISCLGIPEQPGIPMRQLLLDYLRVKKLLLVLDNCEHLIAACAELVNTLLSNAPSVKIIATSREALGVSGELIWHVPSLSLPEVKQALTPEQLSQYEAVQLFIERATLVQPHFLVTNENAPAVAQICFRLDGIPLAIELAAARVKGLNPEQIASRLDDRFRLLTGGSRTALPRQRTLQAAIDWSYRLLSEEERMLLRRLSVFAGGWTLEAAEQVCASDELNSYQILDVLLTLVDKCLVIANTEVRNPRYQMLETIRQYAQEKLDDASEANLARDHHLAYFQGLAAEAKPHLISSQQSVWLKRLEIEHDNIRAALAWAQDSSAVEAGLQLVTDLIMFWFYRAYFREPSLVLHNLLTKTSAGDQIQIIARAYNTLGWLEFSLGNLSVAYAHAQESERLFLRLGQAGKADLAFNQNLLVNIASHLEYDLIQARHEFEANLKLLEEIGDPWWIAHVITSIALNLRRGGDLINARRASEQALALFQKCGDNIRVNQQNAALAGIAFEETKYSEAHARFEEVFSFYRQAHVNLVVDVPLWMLGVIAIREKDYALAKKWYSECLLFDLQIGSPLEQLPECLIGFAGIAHSEERFERAVQLLGGADTTISTRQIPLETFDQAELQRLTTALREVLGDAKFEELAAEGRAMTIEQAIAVALEEIDE